MYPARWFGVTLATRFNGLNLLLRMFSAIDILG